MRMIGTLRTSPPAWRVKKELISMAVIVGIAVFVFNPLLIFLINGSILVNVLVSIYIAETIMFGLLGFVVGWAEKEGRKTWLLEAKIHREERRSKFFDEGAGI